MAFPLVPFRAHGWPRGLERLSVVSRHACQLQVQLLERV